MQGHKKKPVAGELPARSTGRLTSGRRRESLEDSRPDIVPADGSSKDQEAGASSLCADAHNL